VAVELIAVRLERARVAFSGGDLCFEARKPPTGQRVEAQPRRDRHDATPNGGDERRAVASRLPDVGPTVRNRSLPACRQQTAYLPLGCR